MLIFLCFILEIAHQINGSIISSIYYVEFVSSHFIIWLLISGRVLKYMQIFTERLIGTIQPIFFSKYHVSH